MKILYLIFLIMSAVFYPLFKDDLSFILLITLLIFPVIMLIMLIFAAAKVRIKAATEPASAVRGEKLEVRLNIKNPLFVPISSVSAVIMYRTGKEKFSKYTVSVPIKARSSENVVISIVPAHCGVVECVIKKAVLYDFIGLISLGKKLNFHSKTIILPRESDCGACIDDPENKTEASFRYIGNGSDPSEISGLHSYIDGDRMNRIHWKLSSRTEELIVKEYTDPAESRILIIPDINACKSRSEVDVVMDLSASLARFLISEASGCSIMNGGSSDCTKLSTDDELDLWLNEQVSSRLEASSEMTMTAAFAAECTESASLSPKLSHILIITPRENKAALTELEHSGISRRITVLCTGNEGCFEEDKNSDVIVYFIGKDGKTELPESFAI